MLRFPAIDVNLFYRVGVWCFGLIALFNTISFVLGLMNDRYLYPSDIVSAAVSLIFNYLLFGFFYYLNSTLPPKNLLNATVDDMEQALKETNEK